MRIFQVTENKKQYLPLLLAADEQESMIDRYLERGDMYVLDDNGIKADCLVTDEGGGILEIKNIAVSEGFRGLGYGKTLIEFIAETYGDNFSALRVGTGDSPLTLPFYEKCGFTRWGEIKNFFTDNYDHPIIECGVKLTDMIILQRKLK